MQARLYATIRKKLEFIDAKGVFAMNPYSNQSFNPIYGGSSCHPSNQPINQDEEVKKAVRLMCDLVDSMNKLDSNHQQQALSECVKIEMLKTILKM